jgi:hypothetical protein
MLDLDCLRSAYSIGQIVDKSFDGITEDHG